MSDDHIYTKLSPKFMAHAHHNSMLELESHLQTVETIRHDHIQANGSAIRSDKEFQLALRTIEAMRSLSQLLAKDLIGYMDDTGLSRSSHGTLQVVEILGIATPQAANIPFET